MGTIVLATAHGFVANDPIAFLNLDGGEGIIEGTLYYVLAGSLTANQFTFSRTVGGAAQTFATDIVSGSVVPWGSYTVVTDGVMDPPVVPTTTSAPTVTSSASSGVVRLKVVV